MIKTLTIIGARPQFIKAAALSRAIKNSFSHRIRELILHTGQHYDENMSDVFFKELQIPSPDFNLSVGSSSHGVQTAQMIEGIERILIAEKPDCVILYGDTNSTLSGAVAASKLHVPVVHIEAGMRSFNKSMPEEINRIICDHCSTLLFSPTKTGINNLIKEGFNVNNKPPFTADNPGIFHCGDVMLDNTLFFSKTAKTNTTIIKQLGLKNRRFVLVTIHRPVNTDDTKRLISIFKALISLAETKDINIVIPLHPRTSKIIQHIPDISLKEKLSQNDKIKLIPAVSFLEMVALEEASSMIITDSGGVQKEACFLNKPCIILRKETEWVEIVESGCTILVDADEKKIIDAFLQLNDIRKFNFPDIFGDGKAAEFIVNEIIKAFERL